MFEVTQRGDTTTVNTGSAEYKITYSERFHRFQVKLKGKLVTEGSFQECLNQISARA